MQTRISVDKHRNPRRLTVPPRRISIYEPPELPAGHIPPKRDPPRRRHGAPSGPWPFVDIDDKVDQAQLDDPSSQYREHLTSPCPHQSIGSLSSPTFFSAGAKLGSDLGESAGHQFHAASSCWCKYPQSLYPNWTQRQQEKSKISDVIKLVHPCRIRYLDMKKDGTFVEAPYRDVTTGSAAEKWEQIKCGRASDVHLRMLFVDNSSGPVLQMLGTRYNIEPFFFSSTIGWIPTRFQSNIVPHESDHITIVFTFMRSIPNPTKPNSNSNAPSRAQTAPSSPVGQDDSSTVGTSLWPKDKNKDQEKEKMMIDTQKPLPLRSNNTLLILDRLALHMVRCRRSSSSSSSSSPPGSTIISLHPTPQHMATTAETMHSRVNLTGRSVYWKNIFKAGTQESSEDISNTQLRDGNEREEDKSKAAPRGHAEGGDEGKNATNDECEGGDPTFVFLSFLWYAAYAWDESLEGLYSHICTLETQVIHTNDLDMTNELHVIQAHLLHFEGLLEDFKQTIEFVRDTPNPAMDRIVRQKTQETEEDERRRSLHSQLDRDGSPDLAGIHKSEDEKAERERTGLSHHIMKRECHNLLSDVARLERQRHMMEKRLKNIMDLGFALINIEDSHQTQILTEAALRDGAAIKQIAYLSMVFLPATFVATAFGMNITSLAPEVHGTLEHYLEAALPLTALTVWIVVAYQIRIEEFGYEPSGSRAVKKKDNIGQAEGDVKVIDADGYSTNAIVGDSNGSYNGARGTSGDSWSYTAPGSGHFGQSTHGEMPVRFKKMNAWERMLWPIVLFKALFERWRARTRTNAGEQVGLRPLGNNTRPSANPA